MIISSTLVIFNQGEIIPEIIRARFVAGKQTADYCQDLHGVFLPDETLMDSWRISGQRNGFTLEDFERSMNTIQRDYDTSMARADEKAVLLVTIRHFIKELKENED